MKPQLELVHFQITKNCNLRCWFCGQWGKKGFFSDENGKEVTFSKWVEIANELKNYQKTSKILPKIMLWGGEPLVSPYFEKIVNHLHSNGFEIGMVTNGVYIDKYYKLINECFSVVYVSIDGVKSVHDKIRGEGVYNKVISNLKLIDTNKVNLRIMSVITEELINNFDKFTEELSAVKPQKLILQEMIYLTKTEADNYSNWLKNSFNQDALSINSWVGNCKDYKQQIAKLLSKNYAIKVEFIPHNNVDRNCYSPFKHAHIAWNGNVLFCTDFYDFSAGNVNDNKLLDIFNGELANKYREEILNGNCATCKHCSWRNSQDFNL